MKRNTFITILFTLCTILVTQGQHYQFNVLNQAYEPLETADYIDSTDTSGGVVFASTLKHKLHDYMVFGQPLNSEINVGVNGYLVGVNSQYGFTFDPFLADLYLNQTTSKVLVAEYRENGDSVLAVEWRDMALETHPETDFINFQLRLFKKARTIEFHYGPSQITKPNAFQDGQKPIAVISHLSTDFNTVYEQVFFGGNPDEPSTHLYPDFQYISGFPSNGVLYRFTDSSATSTPTPEQLEVKIYPNPTSSQVTITAPETVTTCKLLSSTGATLLEQSPASASFQLNLERLPKGVAILELHFDVHPSVRKVLTIE